MKSPAQVVKDRFGEKKKLLDALKPFLGEELWVGRENEDKGLAHVSNAKLLRLFDTFSAVKSKWGSRAKLIAAVLESEGRQADTGFKSTLETWPVPRLFDRFKSAERRRAHATKAVAPAKKPAAKAEGVVAKAVKAVEKAVEKVTKPAKKAASKK